MPFVMIRSTQECYYLSEVDLEATWDERACFYRHIHTYATLAVL